MRITTVPAAALLFAAALRAHEHAPRVLSPHVADTYSLKTFADFERWRALEGDAKAFEVFRYLADQRTGVYPMGVPAREGPEVLYEYGSVTDPVKMLNVYPLGHCGTLGPAMAGIAEGMGLGPARTLIIPAWGHVASEVFYGGKWHYLDLDVRAAFRRADGSLASIEDARSDPSLWTGPNGPLFFPLDPLEGVEKAYRASAIGHRHGVASGGHTMDYLLRQGESLKRWWKPQGGRWSHHPSYAERPFPRDLLDREPRGPKCKHPGFTVHTHGNGRFLYRPDLTDRSSDFEDGVYEHRNVRPGPSGLKLAAPGEGHATFEVRSPYVIVPLVGDPDVEEDDREASTVKIEATGAALALSLDGGREWKDLPSGSGEIDLTHFVKGRYGYLLRITLSGEPEKAELRSLEITTWVQLHPASLPSLRKGRNRMRYVRGDHHGLPTHLLEVAPAMDRREDFLRYLAGDPPDFDPSRRTRRAVGPFTVRVPAPPGSAIAWFSAGGSFVTHQGADAPKTANTMAYASGEPRGFRTFYRSAVPAGNDHWHYNADVEVKLDQPAKDLFIRYVGDPGVNAVRVYAHCLRERPCASSPVEIRHAFREKGVLLERTFRLEGAEAAYDLDAEEPEDEWVEISVPSIKR